MDWPAMQGQHHATSWPVEKIHHTWSFGSDATVLDDYALTTTTNWTQHQKSEWASAHWTFLLREIYFFLCIFGWVYSWNVSLSVSVSSFPRSSMKICVSVCMAHGRLKALNKTVYVWCLTKLIWRQLWLNWRSRWRIARQSEMMFMHSWMRKKSVYLLKTVTCLSIISLNV